MTLTLASSVGVGEAVTVNYTVPTGMSANPIRDVANNTAAGFSGESARNDTTSVAIASDPGADSTYSVNDSLYHRDVIELTVTFGESISATGSLELPIEIGGSMKKARFRERIGHSNVDVSLHRSRG